MVIKGGAVTDDDDVDRNRAEDVVVDDKGGGGGGGGDEGVALPRGDRESLTLFGKMASNTVDDIDAALILIG